MPHCPIHPKTALTCPACAGSITSPAKAASSRANGAKSKGRPPKAIGLPCDMPCPLCNNIDGNRYYRGLLGYEAVICADCGMETDLNNPLTARTEMEK